MSEMPNREGPVTEIGKAADLWKLVDGDMREGMNGAITYHAGAFRQGLELGRVDQGHWLTELRIIASELRILNLTRDPNHGERLLKAYANRLDAVLNGLTEPK